MCEVLMSKIRFGDIFEDLPLRVVNILMFWVVSYIETRPETFREGFVNM